MYADDGLFVVADGMGGHLGGAVASSLAVKTLAANSPSTRTELLEAVRHANQVVHRRAGAHQYLTGMGTTLCAIAMVSSDSGSGSGHDDGQVWCLVNVGDSRVYRCRGGRLTQLTEDHNFVAEMVRAGDLSAEAAAGHPRRNTLTRAVGVEPDVQIDDWVLEVIGNDRFLLCTDGLTNELDESEIAELLSADQHPSQVARALVQRANDLGGRDNSTALVIDVIAADDAATPGRGAAADAHEQAADQSGQPGRARRSKQRGWRRSRRR